MEDVVPLKFGQITVAFAFRAMLDGKVNAEPAQKALPQVQTNKLVYASTPEIFSSQPQTFALIAVLTLFQIQQKLLVFARQGIDFKVVSVSLMLYVNSMNN